MIVKRTTVTLVFAFWTATMAVAEEKPMPPDLSGSYLCRATASAGIKFEPATKDWKSALFGVAKDALIVKVRFTGKTGKFSVLDLPFRIYKVNVNRFGEQSPWDTICYGERDEANKVDREFVEATGPAIRCTQISLNYWFNFQTKHFQYTYDGDYMDPQSGGNTPYVSVGLCEKVD